MLIQPEPPFELVPETDGTQHAIKGHIKISVLPNVGEVIMKHRVGNRPQWGAQSRWLYINLPDKDLRIYVNGTHIVITEQEFVGTFASNTKEELIKEVLSRMIPGSGDHKQPIVNTPENAKLLAQMLEMHEMGVISRLNAGANYNLAKELDK